MGKCASHGNAMAVARETYAKCTRLRRGTRWRCATSWKVAGSIPDGVIGIFHWHKPSGRTMTLGLTQPLTEMSTRNISWGIKAAGAWGWQPYCLHVPIVLKSRSLTLLEPSGPVQACCGIALPLPGYECLLDTPVVETVEFFCTVYSYRRTCQTHQFWEWAIITSSYYGELWVAAERWPGCVIGQLRFRPSTARYCLVAEQAEVTVRDDTCWVVGTVMG